VVENAFGQLAHRFRIFLRMLDVDYRRAARLVQAAVILHNFLGPINEPIEQQIIDVVGDRQVQAAAPGGTNNARAYRERFVQHFSP
jgi:hypothetical protein